MSTRPLASVATAPGISGWGVAVAVFALVLAIWLGCYWPTAYSLVEVWAHDGTYQYAFLIYPLSAWLAYDQRARLGAGAPVPSVWGLGAIAALVAVWYVGALLDVNLFRHFAFVAMLPALVLACWGWRALRVLMFPSVYLVAFAVPWGDGLVGPLQDITASFAVHALDASGMLVLLNGREIITPSAVWMVEAACSGVKFFIACTALGCLFGYLMFLRPWKRIAFAVLAAAVPVIANGLRVYFTVLIGEKFGLHYATGTDHMLFGWQFFGTVLVLLLWLGWFFRDQPAAPVERPVSRARVAPARRGVWLLAGALLVAGPLAAIARVPAPAARAVPPVVFTAPRLPGFSLAPATDATWAPVFKGAAATLRATYFTTGAKQSIDVFHAVYRGVPRAGHHLVAYGNRMYDPTQARVLMGDDREVTLAAGRRIHARELRLAEPAGSRLVWYWYCVENACSASPVVTKLRQVWVVLRGRRARSSVWAVSTVIIGGQLERARVRLASAARVLPVHLTVGVQGKRT